MKLNLSDRKILNENIYVQNDMDGIIENKNALAALACSSVVIGFKKDKSHPILIRKLFFGRDQSPSRTSSYRLLVVMDESYNNEQQVDRELLHRLMAPAPSNNSRPSSPPPSAGSNYPAGKMRPIGSMLTREVKKERMRIIKNITVISISYMLLFTAFSVTCVLQVQFYKDECYSTDFI